MPTKKKLKQNERQSLILPTHSERFLNFSLVDCGIRCMNFYWKFNFSLKKISKIIFYYVHKFLCRFMWINLLYIYQKDKLYNLLFQNIDAIGRCNYGLWLNMYLLIKYENKLVYQIKDFTEYFLFWTWGFNSVKFTLSTILYTFREDTFMPLYPQVKFLNLF